MALVRFKTRHDVVALNPDEVSDVIPYPVVDAGVQTLVRMHNRVEHIVFEPFDIVLIKLGVKS